MEESKLRQRLRRLPKAELHLHLEGCIRPEMLLQLSRRHQHPFGLRSLEGCRGLYRFRDFAGFIQAIKKASQHLVDPEDYAAVVLDLARALRAQGVVYAEVFFSVGILLWRKGDVEPYWMAIEAARREAERETGVRLRWIFDAVRQFGAEHLDLVVDWAIRCASTTAGGAPGKDVAPGDAPGVIGIGIGGDERGGPAEWFAAGFERARRSGLHLTAHAGETAGPESVRAALDVLHVERIGHGLRAFEDAALLQRLSSQPTVWLDICPTSNLKTGVWRDLPTHPVRDYFKRGIPVCLASDDPAIFAVELLDEYEIMHECCDFDEAALVELARNSFRASFMPEAEKRGWLAAIDQAK